MNREELELLIHGTEVNTLIAELMNGRGNDAPNVEEYQCHLEPEYHKVNDKTLRRDKIVNCTDDEFAVDDEGTMRINDGMGSTTTKRIEPVARIALALQKLVVNRAVAFLFGNDVVIDSETENEAEERVLKAVRAVFADNKVNTLNRRVARITFSSTECAECWYPIEYKTKKYGFDSAYKLRCTVFNPLKGDKLYPYFSDNGDLIAFSREYVITDQNRKQHRCFETFTDAEHIVWNRDSGEWTEILRVPNPIGKIPVIYARQDEVEWADVQGLIERLETLLSNFADTNDYHASPKIFVTGQINGWTKKGESGAVIEGEEGAKAEYLSWQHAPESVKLEIETLLKMVYSITQTPDISFDSVKGLNISGVSLKLLFMDAHMKTQVHAEVFDEYIQRRTSVVSAYLAQMNAGDGAFVEACNDMTLEPEIVPYMISDEEAAVNMLATACGQKPLISQRTAISQLGWVNDVDAEQKRIDEEEKASSQFGIDESTF